VNAPLQRWYEQSLTLVPEISDIELRHFAKIAKRPLSGASRNREDLKRYLDPLVKRCRAKTRARYWMWLRQQIAKMGSDDAEFYFQYLKESYLPVECDAPFQFELSLDGNTALILVEHNKKSYVWRLPVRDLDWAKSIHPVHIRRVLPLESPEVADARNLRTRLRGRGLGFAERRDIKRALANLEEKIKLGGVTTMPERFGVFKAIDQKEVSVARLYLRANVDEDVDFLDGNPLNFCPVPSTTISRPVYFVDTAVIPGVADPLNPVRTFQTGVVSNLYIIQSGDNPHASHAVRQEKFEKMLPAMFDDRGEMLGTRAVDHDGEQVAVHTGTSMPINRAFGSDAGTFKPLGDAEAAAFGLKGLETTEEVEKEPEITEEIVVGRSLMTALSDSTLEA
jgi:hypothetical protein